MNKIEVFNHQRKGTFKGIVINKVGEWLDIKLCDQVPGINKNHPYKPGEVIRLSKKLMK